AVTLRGFMAVFQGVADPGPFLHRPGRHEAVGAGGVVAIGHATEDKDAALLRAAQLAVGGVDHRGCLAPGRARSRDPDAAGAEHHAAAPLRIERFPQAHLIVRCSVLMTKLTYSTDRAR